MAITQAQIIESMVAATLEEKRQWVSRLQRKYDRAKSNKTSNGSLSQNRTPSFMHLSEKDLINPQDGKSVTSKLYEGNSGDDHGSSSLSPFTKNNSNNSQTQKTTVSS
jgi:hypothetical protein